MFVGQDRGSLRRVFHEAWRGHLDGRPLQPLEAMVVEVVALHPEYHALLANPEDPGRDYPPEAGRTNPYLHLAMHLALREQLTTGRPTGIIALHGRFLSRHGDPHQAEHAMLECLGEALWQAQRQGTAPDETAYLECLNSRLGGR